MPLVQPTRYWPIAHDEQFRHVEFEILEQGLKYCVLLHARVLQDTLPDPLPLLESMQKPREDAPHPIAY